MDIRDCSVTELHQQMPAVIEGARTGTLITRITYHGVPVAAIIPLQGPGPLMITRAFKELNKEDV